MPRGVTDQFLKILANERRHGLRTALACAGLVPLAYFMAELTDRPLLGWVVLASLLSLAAGAALGGWWAHRRHAHWQESLRQSWNAWMRMSLSCNRVEEVARHVEDKGRTGPALHAGWGVLLVANAVLFLALWVETPWALGFGVLVCVANGLSLGAVAAHALWNRRWSGQFNRALEELVTEGRIGLWGEV